MVKQLARNFMLGGKAAPLRIRLRVSKKFKSMTNRRVTTIEEMFNDIAAPVEKQKVDELYETGRKGSAIIYMLRRIKSQWDKVFSRHENPVKNRLRMPDSSRLQPMASLIMN
jgi:hypothetical protein